MTLNVGDDTSSHSSSLINLRLITALITNTDLTCGVLGAPQGPCGRGGPRGLWAEVWAVTRGLCAEVWAVTRGLCVQVVGLLLPNQTLVSTVFWQVRGAAVADHRLL